MRRIVCKLQPGLLLALVVGLCMHEAAAQNIATYAGNGTAGFIGDGGPATSASMDNPNSVALDGAGNIYITDIKNFRIRKVSATDGTITTVAGNGAAGFSGDGGPAVNASLNEPTGIAIDGAGNLYIADYYNSRVRKVSAADGTITTVAGNGTAGFSGDGGLAVNASLMEPYAVTLDEAGNLYISDWASNRVRKVNASDGIITTVAGNGTDGFGGDGGPATSASLSGPHGIALDREGNLYIADLFNNRIRKVNAVDGIISTVAGNGIKGNAGNDGPATSASLNLPMGVAVDAAGNVIIADTYSHMVRKVGASDGVITKVAGTVNGFDGDGGPAISASLSYPSDIALDKAGNMYVADQGNHRIRFVGSLVPSAGAVSFSVDEDMPYQGVLAGSDPTGKPLTYSVVSEPGKGAVILNPETGAFTFTPAANLNGNDTFTYKVNNGTADSEVATVSITITPVNDAPVAVAGPVTVVVVASCEATVFAKTFNNGSSDADGDALTYTVAPAGPYPIGVTEVTLTATDSYGANSSAKTTITVEDNTAPVARAKNFTVRLSYDGTAKLNVSDINNGSTDNCSLASISLDKTNLTCADIGDQTITLTVTDGQGNSANATAIVTVLKAEQVINFTALPNVTYGDAPITLAATVTSGAGIAYAVTGPATLSGNVLTVTGIGEVSVTASLNSAGCYEAAEVTQTFQVAKKMLTVSADPKVRTYGEGNPALTYTIAGFAGADSEEGLDVKPAISTDATTESNAGSYTITVAGASDNLYDFTYQTGILSVEKASVAIAFADLEQPEDGNPKQVAVTTTPAGLAVTLTYNGSVTAPTKAGAYEVVATVNEANYAGTATATLLVQGPTGIGDEMKELKGVALYPNPTTDGKVYLELKNAGSKGALQVQVYATSGKLLHSKLVTGPGTQEIDLAAQPAGLYFVRVTDGSYARTFKVRKQ